MPDQETRTLLIQDKEGVFKITIPADWKITFSGFNPAQPRGGLGHALRMYEGRDKQRCCFTNVIAFRDMSLPLQRIKEGEDGKVTWADDDGFNDEAGEESPF